MEAYPVFLRQEVQELIITFTLHIDINYTNEQSLGRKVCVPTEEALLIRISSSQMRSFLEDVSVRNNLSTIVIYFGKCSENAKI